MAADRLTPSQHPTAATVLATQPTLDTPCVYCGTPYRSEPCGAVHMTVRARLRAPGAAPAAKTPTPVETEMERFERVFAFVRERYSDLPEDMILRVSSLVADPPLERAARAETERNAARRELAEARAALAALRERLKQVEELSALQDKLLAAYRTGRPPSGKVLDRMAALRAALSGEGRA